MKPLIFFVDDDDGMQIPIKELGKEEGWEIECFTDPLEAMKALVEKNPAIILSDQKMANMRGDEFLSVARQMSPHSIRIMQTGYSDERELMYAIRNGRITDFIKKPWPLDFMRQRLKVALDLFKANEAYRTLSKEGVERSEEIKELKGRLTEAMNSLELMKKNVPQQQQEIFHWAPPQIVYAVTHGAKIQDQTADIASLAFQLVGDSNAVVAGRPLQFQLFQIISDAVLRHNGWRESLSSGPILSHFGILGSAENPADAAMSTTMEIMTAINNLLRVSHTDFRCVIALDFQTKVQVQVHNSLVNTQTGMVSHRALNITGINARELEFLIEEKEQMDKRCISVAASSQFYAHLSGFKQHLEEKYLEIDGKTKTLYAFRS
jgi:FixJ family two-component response regulator